MTGLRRIAAAGSIKIKDDENWPETHEYGTYRVGGFAVVGSDLPARELENGNKCVGGEVRFEIELDAEYISNGNVRIRGEARLFEGTSCNTMDQEDDQQIEVIVPKDGTTTVDINLHSSGTGGGDYSKGRITFTNVAQPEGYSLPSYISTSKEETRR